MAVDVRRVARIRSASLRRVWQLAETTLTRRLFHFKTAAERLGLAGRAALGRILVGHRDDRAVDASGNVVLQSIPSRQRCAIRCRYYLVGVLVEPDAHAGARRLWRWWRVRLGKHVRAHEAANRRVALVCIHAVVARGVAKGAHHVTGALERAVIIATVRPVDDALAALRVAVDHHGGGGNLVRAQRSRRVARRQRRRDGRRRCEWRRRRRLQTSALFAARRVVGHASADRVRLDIVRLRILLRIA